MFEREAREAAERQAVALAATDALLIGIAVMSDHAAECLFHRIWAEVGPTDDDDPILHWIVWQHVMRHCGVFE